MEKNKIIPSTETPLSVYLNLLFLLIILITIFYSLLGLWGLTVLIIIIGFSTSLFIEEDIPEFHSKILVNSISGNLRVIFTGINFKVPWENSSLNKLIDLRVEFSELCSEKYASKDALMEVKYLYTIKPDTTECFGESVGDKIILFSSYDSSVIRAKGKALFSMLLSDYYASKSGKELLQKEDINNALFSAETNQSLKILDFEKRHGVEVTISLMSSNFDSIVQKYRDSISGAASIDEAIKILIQSGIEKDQAVKIAKLMNFGGYKEKDKNLSINLSAPDLKNLKIGNNESGPIKP